MSTENTDAIKFRKQKKKAKVRFAVQNRIRYFDQNHVTDTVEDAHDRDISIENNNVIHNIEDEDELKFDTSIQDPLYDHTQDRIDETYIHNKYAKQSAIQSDCTLCCANCFIFISYISQKLSIANTLHSLSNNPCTKHTKTIDNNYYAEIENMIINIDALRLKIVSLISNQ